jgi:chromate reductase, NAD(P)H dehydrogenase (quinone)
MRIALMGGSLRPESLNRRFLLHLAGLLGEGGHETVAFVGEDLRLPLYEDGLVTPEPVLRMGETLRGAQGLIIVSPEYNAGIPGHLKNAVDWLSVQKPSPWTGRVVLLGACSPGALGGARSLMAWRPTLANMGALVLPQVLSVPLADTNLDPRGAPTDPRTRSAVTSGLAAFLALAGKLQG